MLDEIHGSAQEMEKEYMIFLAKKVITYTEPPSQAARILLEMVIFTLAL